MSSYRFSSRGEKYGIEILDSVQKYLDVSRTSDDNALIRLEFKLLNEQSGESS